MVDAFDRELADFSGISGGRGLYVDAALHEAFIEVNEEGTEAAAATAVVLPLPGFPSVYLDRPFLFLIRDNETNAILFMGRVAEPK